MGTAVLYVIGDNPMKQIKKIEKYWDSDKTYEEIERDEREGFKREWFKSYKPYEKWYDFLLKSFPNKNFRCFKRDLKTNFNNTAYILYNDRVFRNYYEHNEDNEKPLYTFQELFDLTPSETLITARIVKD